MTDFFKPEDFDGVFEPAGDRIVAAKIANYLLRARAIAVCGYLLSDGFVFYKDNNDKVKSVYATHTGIILNIQLKAQSMETT